MPRETAKNGRSAKTNEIKEETVQEPAEKKCPKAPVYSSRELMDNAKDIFNTRQECVGAALKAAGKEECTVAEAKEIVRKFLKKEVK